MALCISGSVVTGISPGDLSNTHASGMEPVIPVISRPGEVPVIESGTGDAYIPVTPEIYRLILPVPAIEAPVSSPGVLFQELLPSRQSLWLPEPVPVPAIPYPYPSISTPVTEPGTVTGKPYGRPVNGTGTIRWIDLEGGFYGIESDDGAHYLPLDLEEVYKVDGMQVAFSGRLLPGIPSILMWGIPLELHDIAQIRETISGTGTIRWIDLEGGLYGIESDDGAHYLPLDLGEAYKVDGMRIRFSVNPADGMTFAMWGTPVTLISVAGENGASTGVLITYHRTGGIAGFQDDLTVCENGSARISRKGEVQVIQLNSTEFDALRDACDETGFLMLSYEYLPGGEGRDLFFYEITVDGRTILTADTAVPEELVSLIELLNGIVARVAPR